MRNWRSRSWKIARLSVVLAALFDVQILGSIPGKESPKRLVEFYTVDVWDDDYYPYWQSAILHVTRQKGGAEVQYTYIASATQPCGDPAIKGVTVLLPNTKLEELTSGLDLCLLDASSFNRNATKPAKKPEPFSTERSAVVAKCGTEERIFEMPKFEMNDEILKRIEPSAALMSQLSAYVLKKAFPSDKTRDVFWGVDPSLAVLEEESLQLEELRAGAFDKAFWFGFKGVHPGIPAQVVTSVDPTLGSDSDRGKLHNVLENYRHPGRGYSGRTGVLLDSQGFNFKQYVAPNYSPLAAQAGVEGTVTLSLKVDRVSGKVESIDVISGHALLRGPATKAAMQWQFDPTQTLPEQIKVVLNFSHPCGN